MTADSSVIIAALATWHESHTASAAALRRVDVMVSHTVLETYSVLTRLPGNQRIDGALVARMLAHRSRPAPLTLPGKLIATLPARLDAAGVRGGATYDGLVGLTAAHHGHRLLTRDRRAVATYDALDIPYELVGT